MTIKFAPTDLDALAADLRKARSEDDEGVADAEAAETDDSSDTDDDDDDDDSAEDDGDKKAPSVDADAESSSAQGTPPTREEPAFTPGQHVTYEHWSRTQRENEELKRRLAEFDKGPADRGQPAKAKPVDSDTDWIDKLLAGEDVTESRDDDPVMRELAEIREWKAKQEQDAAVAELKREAGELLAKDEYKHVPEDVLYTAYANAIEDACRRRMQPPSLEDVAAHLSHGLKSYRDKIIEEYEASKQAAPQQEQARKKPAAAPRPRPTREASAGGPAKPHYKTLEEANKALHENWHRYVSKDV